MLNMLKHHTVISRAGKTVLIVCDLILMNQIRNRVTHAHYNFQEHNETCFLPLKRGYVYVS